MIINVLISKYYYNLNYSFINSNPDSINYWEVMPFLSPTINFKF